MQIQMSGWKKIYFFYGIIFFAIGLLSLLFNSQFSLPKLAQLTLDNFSRELADLGLMNSGESREVIALNPVSRPMVLMCFDRSGDPNYQALNEQIQFRIEERFQIIPFPVSQGEWFKSPQTRMLLNDGRFLIGLELGANREGPEGPGVIFSLSKTMAAELFNRLVNQQPELPLFGLELIFREQNSLYRLRLREAPFSSEHLLKVTDLLLDLWETADRNLQRGNFRDKFW